MSVSGSRLHTCTNTHTHTLEGEMQTEIITEQNTGADKPTPCLAPPAPRPPNTHRKSSRITRSGFGRKGQRGQSS